MPAQSVDVARALVRIIKANAAQPSEGLLRGALIDQAVSEGYEPWEVEKTIPIAKARGWIESGQNDFVLLSAAGQNV